ncbi:MAG TPA: PDZ domain-containing protein [Blastocatellia bacterium]|nr:PDZ domain-containing protein [Blastocatellia bacterium]
MKMFRFSSRLLLLFMLFALLPNDNFAQRPKKKSDPPAAAVTPTPPPLQLTYELSFPQPHTHLYEVTYIIGNITQPTLELQMPTWTPGSYLQREFARHVQDFAVRDKAGNALPWEKIDKATWRVTTNGANEIRASYRVYAYDLTVRTSHLDASHAYFNGANLFLYVKGALQQPLKLKINAPSGWQITSPLALAPDADGYFHAPNYDILVDSPTEIGTHKLLAFDALGKRHRIALWGEAKYNEDTLKRDFAKIVEAGAAVFGSTLPYDHYTFIIHLQPGIGGGLEHLNSTTCQASPDAFLTADSYRQFLSLIAHEYFHLWNVKRIRPLALGPFDYQTENYTRGLWFSEGVTDYYADQLLLRAGLIKADVYGQILGNALAKYEATPGRNVQSPAAASFDAWIKYYRPDENSVNTAMSYYESGAILGMLFDLEIRARTGNAKSLDDVMRLLYEKHGWPKPGFTDAELKAAFETVAGADLSEFWRNYVTGTASIDFNQHLAKAGLRLEKSYLPRVFDVAGQPLQRGDLGLRLREGSLIVSNVLSGPPAYEGGIYANDEIVALNGQRLSPQTFNLRVLTLTPGTTAAVTLFRREKLLTINLTVAQLPPDKYTMMPINNADAQQIALRKGWLSLP